ncbi:MAG: PAS domain-containing protein [Methylophilaceae bacterium]|jgi:PAS domain S-box-containing protein|nr:PAS domain-containing protein [Methylophilaceae bacterium]
MIEVERSTDIFTILIVGDPQTGLGVILEALEGLRVRILLAHGGEEGMKLVESELPDLILLDVLMSEADGFTVCRQLKAQESTRDIPVMFITACEDAGSKASVFQAGGVDYLTKPFQAEEVLARVGTHLKLRAMQKKLDAKNSELLRYRIQFEELVTDRTAALSAEIEDRKQAELMLKNESLRLKTLLQTIPDPVWLKDPNGVYLAANAALARVFGACVDDIIGRTDFDFVSSDLAGFFRRMDKEVMSSGETRTNEEWVPEQDGRKRLWETVKTPLYDVTSSVVGVLGISRDITEHRRLQDDLRAKKQYQRALLDNFPFMVWLKDTESRFLAVNQRFADAAGYETSESFYGKTDLDFWPEDLAVRYRADDGEVLRTGEKKHVEEHIVERGVRKWFETYKAPVIVDGQLLGTVGFARDITEYKRHGMLEETRLRMFERLTAGVTLNDVLQCIVEYVEDTHPDFVCSIMLVDKNIRCLRSGPASSSLSQEYLQAVDGIAIGPGVGSCGAAAWSRETTIVEDIRSHPYWAPYRSLALNAGFLSCWSEPILDSHGAVLGVFGIYRREPGCPSDSHLTAVRRASGLAAIVIERKLAEEALHKREQEFRTLAENSPDVVARLNADCRYVYCNAQLESVIGLQREWILGHQPIEISDHEAVRRFQEKVKEALTSGRETEIIHVMDVSYGARKIHDHVRFVPEFDQFGHAISVLVIGRDISALKETERQLRTLVENIPDFVMRLDTEGRHMYVSPTVLRAFNRPQEYFLGRTSVDISFSGEPSSDQQMLDAVHKSASEGVPVMLTMTITQAQEPQVFDLMYVPERDEFGNVISVLGVARDITCLQVTHRALQKKEALLRSLIDSIPDLIFFKDMDSRYLGFNKAFAEYCGHSEAQMAGKTDYDFAPREVAESYRQKDREMLASGKARHNDEWITYPDGRTVLLDTRKTPLYGADGKIIGLIGISRDITERRRIEDALARRELEFRTLAENSPDLIIRFDRECHLVYINPAFARYLDIPLAQAQQVRLEDLWQALMPWEDYHARLKHVMASGEGDQILLEWRKSDGGLTSHLMQMIAEYDEHGDVEGVLAIGHNITELKATERRLEKSRAQLRAMTMRREEAREEERKRIAREIHDELGQLLSVLRLNITTLDYRFGEIEPELRLKAQRMVETMDRAIIVVRNLATRLRPAALNAGIVSALEWQAQEFFDNTGIECVLHLPNGEISLDEERSMAVFRIAQESLTNILRHAQASRADIFLRCSDGICELGIRDDGQGFDPARTASQNSFGIIGMRERALMLGGTLQIDSEVGRGAILRLRIPVDNEVSQETE